MFFVKEDLNSVSSNFETSREAVGKPARHFGHAMLIFLGL